MTLTRGETAQPIESKPQMLCRQLTELAHRLGPGARLPRVLEMSRDFQVAPSTLNQALHEVERSGLITRRRGSGVFVTELAAAHAIKTHIALICRPSLFRMAGHSPVWDMLVQMIQERTEESGAHFDCYFSREEGATPPLPNAIVKAVEERQINGVFGVGLPEKGALWIMEQGVPVVNLFSRGHVTVLLDASQTISLGLSELRARGCSRIAVWIPILEVSSEAEARRTRDNRRTLFESALSEAERAMLPELTPENYPWMNAVVGIALTSAQQGFEMAQRTFRKPRAEWPDGIIITEDTMTHGVLMALRQLNLQVGRDVQIATHANKGTPLLMGEDDLVRVEVNPEEIVNVLFAHMETLRQQTPNRVLDAATKEEIVRVSAQIRLPQKGEIEKQFSLAV